MSDLNVNSISSADGLSAPDFPNGVKVNGGSDAISHYEEVTVVLDNGITGSLKLTRIGNTVIGAGTSAWTHASQASLVSTSGIVPVNFRPSNDVYNVYIALDGSLAGCWRMGIETDGRVNFTYYDANFATVARTSTLIPPTISYVIT